MASAQSYDQDQPMVNNTESPASSPEPFDEDEERGGTPRTAQWDSQSPRGQPQPQRTSAPLQKRRRVTRACDECRRKKIKCDGKQPCTHCTVYSYECTYDQPSNRRRNPAPQYIENLEIRLKRAESIIKTYLPNIDLDDPSKDVEAALQQHQQQQQPPRPKSKSKPKQEQEEAPGGSEKFHHPQVLAAKPVMDEEGQLQSMMDFGLQFSQYPENLWQPTSMQPHPAYYNGVMGAGIPGGIPGAIPGGMLGYGIPSNAASRAHMPTMATDPTLQNQFFHGQNRQLQHAAIGVERQPRVGVDLFTGNEMIYPPPPNGAYYGGDERRY